MTEAAPEIGGKHRAAVRNSAGQDLPHVTLPVLARVYDYVLGGATNFDADRKLAERVFAIIRRSADGTTESLDRGHESNS